MVGAGSVHTASGRGEGPSKATRSPDEEESRWESVARRASGFEGRGGGRSGGPAGRETIRVREPTSRRTSVARSGGHAEAGREAGQPTRWGHRLGTPTNPSASEFRTPTDLAGPPNSSGQLSGATQVGDTHQPFRLQSSGHPSTSQQLQPTPEMESEREGTRRLPLLNSPPPIFQRSGDGSPLAPVGRAGRSRWSVDGCPRSPTDRPRGSPGRSTDRFPRSCRGLLLRPPACCSPDPMRRKKKNSPCGVGRRGVTGHTCQWVGSASRGSSLRVIRRSNVRRRG